MTSQRRCILIGALIGLACGAVSAIAFRVASPTQGEIAVVIAGAIRAPWAQNWRPVRCSLR